MWTRIYMAYWRWRLPIRAWKVELEPHVMFGGDRWRWTVTLNDDTKYRGTRYQYSAQACAEQMIHEVKKLCRQKRKRKTTVIGKGEMS